MEDNSPSKSIIVIQRGPRCQGQVEKATRTAAFLAEGSRSDSDCTPPNARFVGRPWGVTVLLSPKLTVRWKLRHRRTNQQPAFRHLTPLSASLYGRERDPVAKNTRMTDPTRPWLALHCQLKVE